MVIDEGICANVVSLSMVEKLNLHATVNSMLNQGKGLQVNSMLNFALYRLEWLR